MSEKVLSKEEIKEREREFQLLQDEYFTTHSKESWDLMWTYVYDACSNSAKKQLKVFTEDFDGKVLNATMDVMAKIQGGEHVKKLSNFVYWYVKGRLYDKKVQFAERCLSYDYYMSTISEKENNY